MKSPGDRLRDAHSAYELLWLLDLAHRVRVPDEQTKQILRAAFLAGTLHGYAEANQDLEELGQKMQEKP